MRPTTRYCEHFEKGIKNPYHHFSEIILTTEHCEYFEKDVKNITIFAH